MRIYPILVSMSLGCGGGVTTTDSSTTDPNVGVPCTPSWSLVTPDPVEGDTVEFRVECQNGEVQDSTLVILDGPAEVEVFADGRIEVPTGLDDAGHLELEIAVQSVTVESVSLDVWVADALGASGNAPVSPVTYRKEFGTMVLHLDIGGADIGDVPLAGTATWDGDAYPITLIAESLADQGQSKRTAILSATSAPIDWNEGGVDERTDLRLFSMGLDPSYMRQRMVHEMWEEMREDSGSDMQATTRAFYTTVYLNGTYHGLYLATEVPDADLNIEAGMDPFSEVWHATTEDANYDTLDAMGLEKVSLDVGFTKVSGGLLSDNSALESWLSSVIQTDADLMWSTLKVTADGQSWLDWMVLCQWAALSGHQTTGHALIRDAVTGTWVPLPWGFTSGLGLDDFGAPVPSNTVVDLSESNQGFSQILTSTIGSAAYTSAWDIHSLEPDGVLGQTWQNGKVDTWQTNTLLAFERDHSVWGAATSPEQGAADLLDWLGQRAVVASP